MPFAPLRLCVESGFSPRMFLSVIRTAGRPGAIHQIVSNMSQARYLVTIGLTRSGSDRTRDVVWAVTKQTSPAHAVGWNPRLKSVAAIAAVMPATPAYGQGQALPRRRKLNHYRRMPFSTDLGQW